MPLPPPSPPNQPVDKLEPELPPVVVNSEDLMRGRQEILIRHRNDVYRLRITRNGRLILSK
jgi:hemin uptake protein HemP